MRAGPIDALTSSTLKHLRERWWDSEFTDFLRETLQPRPGDRILDVGCGVGTGEVRLGQLRISQLRLHGVDRIFERVSQAFGASRAHNVRAGYTVADVRRLPFVDHAFDSTYCVAMLQHVNDLAAAVHEFARVTKPGGRVLAVEPDNSARYWYSSVETGTRAFELASRFFSALESHDGTDLAVGPRLPMIFARFGIEPSFVRLFPVSVAHLGSVPSSLWEARKKVVTLALGRVVDEGTRRIGAEYLEVLDRYEKDASAAGPHFVEIQNTMLFATSGRAEH